MRLDEEVMVPRLLEFLRRLILESLFSFFAIMAIPLCGILAVSWLPLADEGSYGKFLGPYGLLYLGIFVFIFTFIFGYSSGFHYLSLFVAAGFAQVVLYSQVGGSAYYLVPRSLGIVAPIASGPFPRQKSRAFP